MEKSYKSMELSYQYDSGVKEVPKDVSLDQPQRSEVDAEPRSPSPDLKGLRKVKLGNKLHLHLSRIMTSLQKAQ